MIVRLKRIKEEFGTVTFLRTILLLVGLIGLSALGYFGLSIFAPTIVSIVGLAIGLLLRRRIVDFFETLSWVLPAALFIYGIVLFVGERVLGLSREAQLLIITTVTVIVFNVQFWSLSDPSIVNTQRETTN